MGDEGKPRPDLIDPFFAWALGERLAFGEAQHGGERAGRLGRPVKTSESLACMERHIAQAKMGLEDEKHWAAAAFNLMVLIGTRERIARGLLPPELDDLPKCLPEGK